MNQQTRSLTGPTGAQPALPLVLRQDRDRVAVLSMDAPDGNRMSPALVAALSQALDTVFADPAVAGVVLATGQADFCAGAYDDLPPPSPDESAVPPVIAALAALCDQIDAAPKPVVCALRGRVASGGLALALASKGRVAAPGTVFLSPELRLGRLPPGGTAVRLAWRIGAERALGLLRGRSLGTGDALSAGLIDRISDDTVPAALARAASRPAAQPPYPGLIDGPRFAETLRKARAALPRLLPSERQADAWVIEAMEGAQLLAPDQALTFDLVRAQESARLPSARALAHQARAARRAFDPAPHPVQGPVAVALRRDIAARLVPILLREGAQVVLMGEDRTALSDTLEAVAAAQLALVRAKRLTEAQANADWARLSGRIGLDPAAAPGIALADEAHLDWLAARLPPRIPLAGWDCGLDRPRVIPLAPAATRPARLCEVVAREPAAEPLRAAAALVLHLRLSPLVTRKAPVLPEMIRALARAAGWLGAAGVPGSSLAATGLLPEGLGDPEATEVPDLPLSIDRLILLAAVTEGLRLMAGGRLVRPSDLDLAMVMGAGWPEWRGGPMAEADRLGPIVLRHELRLAETLDRDLWSPAPILDEMIRRGWRFEDLNAG